MFLTDGSRAFPVLVLTDHSPISRNNKLAVLSRLVGPVPRDRIVILMAWTKGAQVAVEEVVLSRKS